MCRLFMDFRLVFFCDCIIIVCYNPAAGCHTNKPSIYLYLKTIDFIFIVQVLLGFYENELPYESTFDFDFDLCKNLHDN